MLDFFKSSITIFFVSAISASILFAVHEFILNKRSLKGFIVLIGKKMFLTQNTFTKRIILFVLNKKYAGNRYLSEINLTDWISWVNSLL